MKNCFLLLSVLIFIGCSSDTKTLSVKPSSINFSDTNIGEPKDGILTIKNNLDEKITITNFIFEGSTDYSITSTVPMPLDLQMEEEYEITVRFDPISEGKNEGVLKIRHSGSDKDKIIKLLGYGVEVARIEISESSYDYKWCVTSKTHNHDFELENTGSKTLEISNMYFTDTGASAYTITSGDAPVNIAPNDKHTFTVTFAPTLVGSYPASLNIEHNAVNANKPLIVDIKGEGVLKNPLIQLNVGSNWDLKSVATTLPSKKFIEIDSYGTDPLELTSATLTNNSEFTVDSLIDSNGATQTFPHDVQPGDYVLLYIKFAPTAKTSYNDTLSIFHNANNENSPITINLTGTGRDVLKKTFGYSGSIENWVIPSDTTTIRLEVSGAEGGGIGFGTPGKGAKLAGDFNVKPGEIIKVAVAGKGQTGGQGGGGGGGSFVVLNNQPLIIAGGGGGSHVNNSTRPGQDGVITATCTPHSSTGTGYTAGSGGGWFTDGAGGDYNTGGGKSWANGLTGGLQHTGGLSHWSNGNGGFGGGGGGCWAPGSAGGYNGGVCATSGDLYTPGGTGGGSINNGSNQSNTPGAQTGDGAITIFY